MNCTKCNLSNFIKKEYGIINNAFTVKIVESIFNHHTIIKHINLIQMTLLKVYLKKDVVLEEFQEY